MRRAIALAACVLLGAFAGIASTSTPAAPNPAPVPSVAEVVPHAKFVRAVHGWRRERARAERLADRLATLRARLEYVSPRQDEWECIHAGEGAWTSNTGNGYHGGLQMDWPFMRTYGADMLRRYGGAAELWSPADQVRVADRAFESGRGFRPWPNTARACGLL